jgi:hypothetical protein
LGPGITSALTAFLAFNYLFITPYYTFLVHHPGDLGMLLVFLIVAAVISQLVARAQAGARAATAREREATQLYELTRRWLGPATTALSPNPGRAAEGHLIAARGNSARMGGSRAVPTGTGTACRSLRSPTQHQRGRWESGPGG